MKGLMKTCLSKMILIVTSVSLFILGCKTNPNKVEKIETQLGNTQTLNGESTIGVKEGQAVFQKKVMLNEELRKAQYEVYELEDRVYGNRKYGSLGLYGVLRECRSQLSDPQLGGDGKLMWTEPMDRITDKEEDFKIGIDEQNKLVAITEEFLVDRIQRFRGYKSLLNKRQDEYEDKVAACKTDLNGKKSKAAASLNSKSVNKNDSKKDSTPSTEE